MEYEACVFSKFNIIYIHN